eukprot:XP_017174540.1 PREDICTED: synaptonemal complex protein 3-like [Mus musculus]
MSIKKLWVIPKDGYLLLLDYDSDEEEEQAHSEENVSFSEEWQRFARSVETPMENWNLLSGEQQVRNASELDLMEVQNPVTHDDGNANPEEVVGDTRKKINNKLCEQKFDMDIQKFNEEQEKSVNNYQKEQQALKLSECSQSQTLEAIEDMHEKSMEGSNPEKPYAMTLNYGGSLEQLEALIDGSEHCEQEVTYYCKRSRLLNTPGKVDPSSCY